MTRSTNRRNRICRHCVVRTLAGVAWPMWGDGQGWPKIARCRDCAAAVDQD